VRVFLSYRRHDVGGYAGRLSDALRERLGAKSVFQDVTAIELGEAFTRAIDRALDECDAVLAIIGPGWLTASTSEAGPRLFEPDDYVRLELARALQREVRVVPVLVGGAALPLADALPEDLRGLVERQGMALRDESWHQDVESLVRSLRGEPAVPAGHGRRWLLAGAVAVVLAASGLLTWRMWPSSGRGADASAGIRLPAMTNSEQAHPACPAPNGDGWHAVKLGDHPTGTVKVKTGSLIIRVTHARWRTLSSGKWQVSLDTEIENATSENPYYYGSWNYNYLIVGQHRFDIDPGGCFGTAAPPHAEPGLKGDARVGFVISCAPNGAIALVTKSNEDQVGADASITVTRTTTPGQC
jgi:TIR domain